MTFKSKLWPSTDCNADYLADIAAGSPELGEIIEAHGRSGFFSIGNNLVSHFFIDRVARELEKTMLSYFGVTNALALFDGEFLKSLTVSELAVLGDSVLLLIEQGRAPIDFAEQAEAA